MIANPECVQARKRQPYLRRFANDWATEEFAKQYLKNHRAYCRRKRYDVEEDAQPDEVQDLADNFELHHIDELDGSDPDDDGGEPTPSASTSQEADAPVAGPNSEPMETD